MKLNSTLGIIVVSFTAVFVHHAALADHSPAGGAAGIAVPTPMGGVIGAASINSTTVVGHYEPLPGGSYIGVTVQNENNSNAGVTIQTINGQPTYVGGSIGWTF